MTLMTWHEFSNRTKAFRQVKKVNHDTPLDSVDLALMEYEAALQQQRSDHEARADLLEELHEKLSKYKS
jgi:hypothetical protein